jgi:hypothetical protein
MMAVRTSATLENHMMGTQEITNTEDVIDVRDIIARFESLEDTEDEDDKEELARLTAVLDD